MKTNQAAITIAVAGGTGTVGSQTVRIARERGHTVRVLSRRTGVDVHAGSGLAAALDGVDAVVDLTSAVAFSTEESMAFFPAVTRNLRAAQLAACVGHFLTLGIVGAVLVDDGYYAGKAEQERILERESGGWSLLRATQFHEFVGQMAAAGQRNDVQLVPEMRFVPVAASEVAAALVDLVEQEPRGFAGEFAGPREEDMSDLMRTWVRAQGSSLPIRVHELPGRFGRGLHDGSILPSADAVRGRLTWEEWFSSGPQVTAFAG